MNVHTPCPPPAPVNIHTLFTPYKQLSASSEMQSQYCVTMDTSTLAPKLPYLRYAHMRAHVKHTIVESGKSTIMSSSTVAVVNKSRKSTSWWAHARAETGSQIMPNDGPCACRLLLSHACVYKSDLQTIYNSQLFPEDHSRRGKMPSICETSGDGRLAHFAQPGMRKVVSAVAALHTRDAVFAVAQPARRRARVQLVEFVERCGCAQQRGQSLGSTAAGWGCTGQRFESLTVRFGRIFDKGRREVSPSEPEAEGGRGWQANVPKLKRRRQERRVCLLRSGPVQGGEKHTQPRRNLRLGGYAGAMGSCAVNGSQSVWLRGAAAAGGGARRRAAKNLCDGMEIHPVRPHGIEQPHVALGSPSEGGACAARHLVRHGAARTVIRTLNAIAADFCTMVRLATFGVAAGPPGVAGDRIWRNKAHQVAPCVLAAPGDRTAGTQVHRRATNALEPPAS
eukprot:scaffold3153_cov111-Isochrysis_galbana.AAC.2